MNFFKLFSFSFVAPTPVAVPVNVPKRSATSLVLLEAARIIEKRGLVQGAFQDHFGRVCTVRAMNMAHDNLGIGHSRAYDELSDYLKRRSIIGWNDEMIFFPQTRIVRALKKAAE